MSQQAVSPLRKGMSIKSATIIQGPPPTPQPEAPKPETPGAK